MNIYLASNLTIKFKDALATKEVSRIFRTTATGVHVLWHVGKIAGKYTCWIGLSEYFELLNKCIAECIRIIDEWIRSNASLQEEQVNSMLTFFKRLSGLSVETYSEYHEGIKQSVSILPSLNAALNYSMNIPDLQDISLESQPVGGKAPVNDNNGRGALKLYVPDMS